MLLDSNMTIHFHFTKEASVYLVILYLFCVIFSRFYNFFQFWGCLSLLYKKRRAFYLFFSKTLFSIYARCLFLYTGYLKNPAHICSLLNLCEIIFLFFYSLSLCTLPELSVFLRGDRIFLFEDSEEMTEAVKAQNFRDLGYLVV